MGKFVRLFYCEIDRGRWLKGVKREFVWGFEVGARDWEVRLVFDYWSSELQVLLNGDLVVSVEGHRKLKQRYTFCVGDTEASVVHLSSSFDLEIGAVSFKAGKVPELNGALLEPLLQQGNFAWDNK